MHSAIDLFAGAGGTGLGLKAAGFKILAAIEVDRSAAETYTSNIKVPVIQENIVRVEVADLQETLRKRGVKRLDLLAGCPPCQGFTRLRNSNGAADSRNSLVLKYLDFVAALKPRFALFENVPGLVRTAHGKSYYQRLVKGLESLGYEPKEYLLNAANFGVPQHRLRVIVIAASPGYKPPAIPETHGHPEDFLTAAGILRPWLTVGDVLKDYPPLRPGQMSRNVPNHVAARTGLGTKGSRIQRFIQLVPKNGGSRSEVDRSEWLDCHKRVNGYKDVYGRLSWEAPAGTITGGCTNPSKGRFLHPTQNRALTYREAARLQGFPDTFVFLGSGIAQQIGNAVPPQMAEAIAIAIRTELKRRTRNGPRV